MLNIKIKVKQTGETFGCCNR